MATIKKSELDALRLKTEQAEVWEKRYNSEKEWKNYYAESVQRLQSILTIENENCSKLDSEATTLARWLGGAAKKIEEVTTLLSQCEQRIVERNKTIAKLLHNGINLAAELRLYKTACTDNQEDSDTYYKDSQLWREKYLKLLGWHCDLLWQLNSSSEYIDPIVSRTPLDALNYIHGRCS